ncbi:palmdelphin isoform X2 [Lampris incognitus]|uniref:palmdelphin isoform X2 n=1 Tax=Lampris incognitus TaxID=2546036 RepID=UPI0024B48BDA|nr:palmdelphin isoform X2 [Lampris incognitus]
MFMLPGIRVSMEEADLLKERLLAITDKRRVQEDIAKKRRQIEEEKLKLQYIKKKALREKWLMEGLSQQTEEEQEAMKLQALDEEQQSSQLQANIDRMEKEIEALEAQELNISTNEEVILKRLKEVERTAEDIIKNATATGVRETDGTELNEGCSSPENQNSNRSSSFEDTVTMETTEQSETATTVDCEVEPAVADSPVPGEDLNAKDEQVYSELDSLVASDEKAKLDIVADLPISTSEICELETSGNRPCSEVPCMDQKEALILESEHEELNRNESINSSLSDTLSSADSVYENEAHRKIEEIQDRDPEPEPEADDNENEPNPEAEHGRNPEIETKDDHMIHEIPFEPPISEITEESILEQFIREEVMSDVSNESCHDLDHDEIDECLRVEIAAASSDSETDEKWRTIFSSSINKEDDDSYLDSLQLSAQELFVQKVQVADIEDHDDMTTEEAQLDVPQENVVLEQPDDVISFPIPPQEVTYNPLALKGLSKISEDENENGKDANHNNTTHHEHINHLNSDHTKKLPKDFCVIQETKSENVSTEHVDFQVARKQWLEMEEQTKNQIVSPTAKVPGFHGSHSFMYTPVRNVERPQKRQHDLQNLSLVGDYPHTQFSPCSEDSGLDDSSYRSLYDDPETPIEKEIRIAMEREENFRRERGFSKMGKSTDCAASRTIPRSISTPLTPSFIITSSPSKEPLKQEVSAILEPSEDFLSSPRHGKDAATTEWQCNSSNSNLIILETSSLIIRSASELCLNKAYEQPQEKMFLNNPFFKLRSRSTMSLVDEEIKMVKQREEELKKERASLYAKGRFDTGMILPNDMNSLTFDSSVDVPVKCKSSPSSPMKSAYRMDRSALSCDHRFPDVDSRGRRKSAMALRWEAGEFTKTN